MCGSYFCFKLGNIAKVIRASFWFGLCSSGLTRGIIGKENHFSSRDLKLLDVGSTQFSPAYTIVIDYQHCQNSFLTFWLQLYP